MYLYVVGWVMKTCGASNFNYCPIDSSERGDFSVELQGVFFLHGTTVDSKKRHTLRTQNTARTTGSISTRSSKGPYQPAGSLTRLYCTAVGCGLILTVLYCTD